MPLCIKQEKNGSIAANIILTQFLITNINTISKTLQLQHHIWIFRNTTSTFFANESVHATNFVKKNWRILQKQLNDGVVITAFPKSYSNCDSRHLLKSTRICSCPRSTVLIIHLKSMYLWVWQPESLHLKWENCDQANEIQSMMPLVDFGLRPWPPGDDGKSNYQ